MPGVRAKRKIRNPKSKVSRRPKNRLDISFAGVHPLIQKNWDSELTLHQNYVNLGLVSALQGTAGGTGKEQEIVVEQLKKTQELTENVEFRPLNDVPVKTIGGYSKDPAEKDPNVSVDLFTPIEDKIEVDPKALRIGKPVSLKNAVEFDSLLAPKPASVEKAKSIIAQMEEEAASAVPVQKSASEQEFMVLQALSAKHADDFEAMARDIKLNQYQFSAGQLKRKFKRFKLI